MDRETKKKLHIKMISSLLATLAIAGVAGFLLLRFGMPQHYFVWYPAIPAYFILLCIILSAFMAYYNIHKPGNILMAFFAVRSVKMLLTVGGLFLYYYYVGEKMPEFGITTFVFFMIHRMAEIFLYKSFEKKIKHPHKKDGCPCP